MWQKIIDFFSKYIDSVVDTLVIIGIAFLIILIVGIYCRRFIKRNKNKRKRAVTMTKMLQSIFKYIIVILTVIVILSAWGVNVAPILAGAGIVGVAIGLGAQDLIKDLLSGLSIIFENYFDVDDVVEIKGFKGTVLDIGLKSTKLINWKNEVKVFSNGSIDEVTNFSKNPSVGVVDVEVEYKENIDSVISLLEEKLAPLKESFSQIVEGPNVVGVTNLGVNGVSIRIMVKTNSEQHYAVERAIKKYVKELFDENGIKIPFNQLVIHNDNNKDRL